MAICMIIENPDQTVEQARDVMEEVRKTGPIPAEGARLLLAGPAESGMRIISVWDSEDHINRFFAERLGPAMQKVGVPSENSARTIFPVTTLVAADLMGAAA
jgi:hypothetical protein